MNTKRNIGDIYLEVKKTVIERGFTAEIDWQSSVQFSQIGESDFLRETAWVVLSSGMREAVIRDKFPAISGVFYFWQNAYMIVTDSENCCKHALVIFNHPQKINAIISIAKMINSDGFESFKMRVQNDGVKFIQTLPFMGPATSCHLAKNIGLDFVKPDRHLLRVAACTGYESPRLLCDDISKSVGDRVSVIDLVIWRFATLNPNYIEYFR